MSNQTNGQLKSLVERIENLELEKSEVQGFIGEVYAEAKSAGFDVKILRKVIALRKLSAAEREEAEALLDLYLQALDMQPELPFEETAETTASAPETEINPNEDAQNEALADDFTEPGAGPLPEHNKAA